MAIKKVQTEHKAAISTSLSHMSVLDFRPFSTCVGVGFRLYSQTLIDIASKIGIYWFNKANSKLRMCYRSQQQLVAMLRNCTGKHWNLPKKTFKTHSVVLLMGLRLQQIIGPVNGPILVIQALQSTTKPFIAIYGR